MAGQPRPPAAWLGVTHGPAIRARLWTATLLLAPIVLSGAAPEPQGIAGPYDVAARREAQGSTLLPFACRAIPSPVVDVSGEVFYRPGSGNSIVDEAARARDAAIAKPVNDYMAFVVRTADDYMRSRPADPVRAQCVLDWLDTWAKAGALLGQANQQGRYLRNWTQADLAIAWLTIRDAPGLDRDAKARVTSWLTQLGQRVNQDFRNSPDRNNHLYWAAVSAVSAASISNDRALFDWGIAAALSGLADIQPDGTLPRELSRREKALGYHVFAMQALVLVATFAARNGIDLWHEHDGALLRLGDLLVHALQDPSIMDQKAGYPQSTADLQGWPSKAALSWAEPYYAATRDPRLVPLLRAFRPAIGTTRNGGDMTLAFGSPLP